MGTDTRLGLVGGHGGNWVGTHRREGGFCPCLLQLSGALFCLSEPQNRRPLEFLRSSDPSALHIWTLRMPCVKETRVPGPLLETQAEVHLPQDHLS